MRDRIKVLTWNLNAFTSDRNASKLRLLDRLEWDVALLQELLPGTIAEVGDHYADGVLVSREPASGWPKPASRRRSAVLVRNATDFAGVRLVDCQLGERGPTEKDCEAPRELLVAADVRIGTSTVTVVSAHPPHAAGRSEHERRWRLDGKLRTYAALERFVTPLDLAIVGMDANAWLDENCFEPRSWDDGTDQAAIARFFHERPPQHGLRDAFLAWFEDRPDALAEVRRLRPDGPLALTHVRGGNRPIADRFDVIMAKPAFEVLSIEHNYEDAVAAGSDHAVVVAGLRISSRT